MSAEPQNRSQAVPKHLARKADACHCRNDDLEDPSGEGVVGQAGAPSHLHPRYRLALSPNGTKGAQKA
jgi:hypothetical protein